MGGGAIHEKVTKMHLFIRKNLSTILGFFWSACWLFRRNILLEYILELYDRWEAVLIETIQFYEESAATASTS